MNEKNDDPFFPKKCWTSMDKTIYISTSRDNAEALAIQVWGKILFVVPNLSSLKIVGEAIQHAVKSFEKELGLIPN